MWFKSSSQQRLPHRGDRDQAISHVTFGSTKNASSFFFLKEFWYFTVKSLLLVWGLSEIISTQKAADLPYLSRHVSMLQTWEWEHILVLEWAHLSWILPNMARIEKDWNQKNKQNITRKSRGERDWVLARPKITWSYCWCLSLYNLSQ